ncbi:MAG: hypothetical protein ABUS49_13105 [Acidobacteriota bacterium]
MTGLLLAGSVAFAQQYSSSTVAGTGGSPGWSGDSGPALSAQFTNPLRVAVDGAGNLYIADYSNFSVRKVTKATDVVTTIAGNGSLGFSGDGSSGDGAQVSNVLDVAVDSSGNVYIADSLNSRVRRVDPSGTITTYAGNGARGYGGDGGQAGDASLYFPAGLALDAAGNLYIADYGNATVRKVTKATGVITTVAGVGYSVFGSAPGDGGPATKAFLSMPYSVKLDGAGNIYVGDIGTSSIRRVGLDGKIATYVSNFAAQNFAMDAPGAIYYPDYKTNTIQKILPGGTRLWIAGNGTAGWDDANGGPATSAQFTSPYGVAVDTNGAVYVADAGNAVIRKLTPLAFSVGAVANAANLQAFAPPVTGSGDASNPIAAGEIVVLFGAGLGPDTLAVAAPQNGFFPTQLSGTQVMINGTAAPLIYSSAGAVAAVVPYAVNGLSSAQISVVYQGKTSRVATLPVAPTAPGIFTANATGSGQAAALNQDGTLNSAANPALVGSVITLYATGEGQTSPGGIDGKLAAGSNLPMPVQTVNATIGGLPAVVNYAGAAPTLVAGVMQVNLQLPSGFAPSGAVPVVLQIGGVNSPAVTIAVSGQ